MEGGSKPHCQKALIADPGSDQGLPSQILGVILATPGPFQESPVSQFHIETCLIMPIWEPLWPTSLIMNYWRREK